LLIVCLVLLFLGIVTFCRPPKAVDALESTALVINQDPDPQDNLAQNDLAQDNPAQSSTQ